MFTKTQIEIMKIFVSNIDIKFSILQIAKNLKKPYPLIYNSIKNLINNKYLIKDVRGLVFINYRENISQIGYIESLRCKEVLGKDKSLSLFFNDVLGKMKSEFFIILIFGSYVDKPNPLDIDLLFIIETEEKIGITEKLIDNASQHFEKKLDISVISIKSAYEMLSKRDKINILNESLNKHIILYCAEIYYNMLKNAR